jgi:CspA family cold shock protein
MLEGRVKKWMPDKAYGFIEPADGGADIFVHVSQLQDGLTGLAYGDAVEFLIERRPDGRMRAVDVRVIE